MSIATAILGESGTGKTTSLRNLAPAETLLIQSIKKPLPFKAMAWKYLSKDGGNIITCDDSARIIEYMKRTTRKIIVVDDFQYILANEFMRRTTERGYDKFTEIGRHAWDIVTAAFSLADNVRVYIMAHTNTDDSGKTRLKTIGKMLDEKIGLEGMFTTVLRTQVSNGNYLFSTQNNGQDTVKSPMGMFDSELIPNDLAEVDKAICDYYGISIQQAA